MKKCKFCGQEHDPKEVMRVLGKHSAPYKQGYCSALCYTRALTIKMNR